jgi:quercetin dioxygenase-like cupin family protein
VPVAACPERNTIKRALVAFGMVSALAALWPMGDVQGHEAQLRKNELSFVSAEQAQFKKLAPGVSRAIVWGDPDKDPYGAFTKFAPGFNAGLHMHSHDVWLVVLKGAYLYKDNAGEKRVGADSFIRIPGGKKHWRGGDAKLGALFYEALFSRFDLIPAI